MKVNLNNTDNNNYVRGYKDGKTAADINIIILDWMIAEREMLLKLQEKERAVRSQDFQKAAILLEEQREIEKRLPTLEQLYELKKAYQ